MPVDRRGQRRRERLLLLFYKQVFSLFGVPCHRISISFAFVAGFSFTAGILALLVFMNPEKNMNLLIVGIFGKGIYSFSPFIFMSFISSTGFISFLASGMPYSWWSSYSSLIQLVSPDLTRYNQVTSCPAWTGNVAGLCCSTFLSREPATQGWSASGRDWRKKVIRLIQNWWKPRKKYFIFPCRCWISSGS